MISYDDFEKVDIRVGRITRADLLAREVLHCLDQGYALDNEEAEPGGQHVAPDEDGPGRGEGREHADRDHFHPVRHGRQDHVVDARRPGCVRPNADHRP